MFKHSTKEISMFFFLWVSNSHVIAEVVQSQITDNRHTFDPCF